MSYKTIVLHLVEEAYAASRTALARRLAERFGAHLVGLHVTPPPIVPVGYGEGAAYVGPEIIEAQREAADELAGRLHKAFTAAAGEKAEWRRLDGEPGRALARAGRAADLVISPQAESSVLDFLARHAIEEAALGAGVPVLMLPAGEAPADAGRRVLCGWNGKREAARSLHDALPFLAGAESVVLLALGELEGTPLEEAEAMLRRHGVKARSEARDEPDDVGMALLEAAAAEKADLLVMGAYGHSRLREMVLGGATRHVLAAAPLPVLLSA
ncbi:universal stress protein [Geminicoccaceae bacterium 1502E]|nr:universal stress protein [Geminicoccaceae bacterium 1502E]